MQKKILIYLSFFFTMLLFTNNVPTNIRAIENKEKTIYLTFDDGPGGKVTEEVLDTLKKENVPATFFLIGSQIKGKEKLL